MSFEEEFNSFFNGDDSLYNKIGEAKARKVLAYLKAMVKEDDDNNIEGFKILGPYFDLNKKNITSAPNFMSFLGNDLGEPTQIEEGFQDGRHYIKKTWLDDNGNFMGEEIQYLDESSDKDDITNIRVIPINNLQPNFITDFEGIIENMFSTNFRKGLPKYKTLEDLLEAIVEEEDYDTAALVRDVIKKNVLFSETFKREMNEAIETENIVEMKKLIGLHEDNSLTIQRLLDDYENYFKNK